MSKRRKRQKLKVTVNRNRKDRLFNFIFGREENRSWTLALYNAVNQSDYTDPSLIRFTTLDNYLYVSMVNDTSFVFSDYINLYEHQSTYNPNIPLRMMQYVSELYEGYITEQGLDKYGSSIISLPIPRLVVFYNGQREVEDEKILRLSDAFDEKNKDKADIEVTVKMLNINSGHNNKLMNSCKPLYEYSWFIEKFRAYMIMESIEDAVGRAIAEMPDYFSIKQFLAVHMSEVSHMLSTEIQEKNAKELIAKANYKKGEQDGIVRLNIELICKKIRKGKDIATIADEVEMTVEQVEPIYTAAMKFAPDYNVDKIYEEIVFRKR